MTTPATSAPRNIPTPPTPPPQPDPAPAIPSPANPTAPAGAAPFDLDSFSRICDQVPKIAPLLATKAGELLGTQLLSILGQHVNDSFPAQSRQFGEAMATAKVKRTQQVAAAVAAAPARYQQIWADIHTRPFMVAAGTNDAAFLQSIIGALRFPGACGSCRSNFAAYLRKTPPDFSTPDKYFAWGVDLHNDINLANGKTAYTYEQAKAIWQTVAAQRLAAKPVAPAGV